MIEPLKVGLYILLLIPGFIFVQTKEYHLLREKIPQFEKTFNIILWSAIIWFLAFYSPYLPFADDNKKEILLLINKSCSESKIPELPTRLLELKISLTNFFIIVCLWAFIIANTIGIVRKSRYIDGLLKWVTGRDWYPSVAFRFFKENMNKVIEVKTSEHRYLGILYCAPDKVDDKYIIVTEPYIIHDKKKKKIL